MMSERELYLEKRKQRRLEQLETNEPECYDCGEKRWQALMLDRGFIICHNCRMVQTDGLGYDANKRHKPSGGMKP